MEVLKEYLNTVTHEYKCFGSVPKGPDWIAIPEGAEIYISLSEYNNGFYKDNFKMYWCDLNGWDNTVYNDGNLKYWKDYPILWQRKPAQKNEYLVPQNAGGFMFRTAYDNGYIPKNWIEVPEGTNFAYMHALRKYVYFVPNKLTFTSHALVWQRPTLPEELPFIDDEPRTETVYITAVGKPEPLYLSIGYYIRPKPRKRMYAVLGEWSPDWSQAPEWADAWRMTADGQAWWTIGACKPVGNGWIFEGPTALQSYKAPSFGYAGDWKQSEHKRPVRMEVNFGVKTMTPEQERNAVASINFSGL